MKEQKDKLAELLSGMIDGLEASDIREMIEIPPDSSMGDFAFPCFRLAKTMRKAPQMIAADLAEKLAGNEAFSKVENVNAYVNFFMNKAEVASAAVDAVIKAGAAYGGSDQGNGKTVCIDYSSPNIAKPFHIGHIRSTVIGNSLYKIFDSLGYNVVRINHLGDYGTQFGKMIVAYRKWGSKEEVEAEPIKSLLKYYVKFHEEAEKDPALEDEARHTFTLLENGAEEETALWQWFRDESLKEFNYVYDLLGITFDSYAGESFYSDKMDRVVDILESKGLLKDSDGTQIVDLSEYNMTPALIKKKDGSTLYITRDLAAVLYRKETYDFDKCIYVVASQQNLHFQQLFKIVSLMGFDWADKCVHVPFGMVSLEDGTMSTRKGKVVFLLDVLTKAIEKTKEVIAEKNVAEEDIDQTAKDVGIGAVMFQELSNNRIKDYVFSWDKVLNFEGETGPYVQYTHARACSVLRNAGASAEAVLNGTAKPDMKYITGEAAYELVKAIASFPEVVQDAAAKYEPSVVTRHIIDVAQFFNKFYHDEHILVDNEEEKQAKLALVYAAKQTIANGLALLGIAAPERM
ncbi:MAG: arginine--tRNA ligase [Anaerovoracaceae bacterium]|nr:arginine--tRNA ligase [Bacillota bacterium]MDD7734657.1 arginine--tRNA ligase [Bacillota bacterium]MDY5907054.1 arginine--tRNA ligase [Anaerovoracaceae bacterium]